MEVTANQYVNFVNEMQNQKIDYQKMQNTSQVDVSRERNAINQLRDFYDAIVGTGLGSFWEDYIEEIDVSNIKAMIRMKRENEDIPFDWYDFSHAYQSIKKIIEIEGNEHDYEILDEYMKLLEKIFLQEEEGC